MWNLEYELVLILAVAAIIGWFMGRAVCKSNEYKERSNNKVLSKENQRLEAVLTEKNNEIHKTNDKLLNRNDQIKELEHENSTASTMLSTLNDAHKEAISELQTLKPYPVRFEQVSKECEEQSQQLGILNKALQQNQENIKAHQVQSSKQQEQLAAHTKKVAELEQEELLLQNSIEALKNQLSDSHNDGRSQSDKMAELLEQYNELKKELQARQTTFEEAVQEKDRLAEDNSDLVSRLRAISSVVGAVGTEAE